MQIKLWIVCRLQHVVALTFLASGMCSAGVTSECIPKVIATVDSAKSSAESGCGEDADCVTCNYQVLELNKLFDGVAGDEPLLKNCKDQNVGDLKYSVGGELRYRFMDERNRLRPGGPGQSDYQLWRFTPFLQAHYNDFIGGYVQAIDASMFGLDAPYTPTVIDINRTDLLLCYAELDLGDVGDGRLKYRYGRQFLQYGGQRVLSSLAWANTYRNFEGHKLMYASSDWDIDAFAMQSLNGASGSENRPYSFDQPDQSRWISGVYSTWKGWDSSTIDFYYLYFDEQEPSPGLMDGTRSTIGSRYAGKHPVKDGKSLVGTWNWDVEGAYQFGEDSFGPLPARSVQAGMIGALGGYTFETPKWKPSLGGIFYWGSGDKDPTTGTINTYNILYPLNHAYWGQIDNLGGQNLLDYGVQAAVKPTEKLSVVTQWHYFEQAQASNVFYSVAGTPLPGSGSPNLGNELDFVGTWTYSKTFNLQAGYFWFFYGHAITQGPLARSDAEQFYLQATYNF